MQTESSNNKERGAVETLFGTREYQPDDPDAPPTWLTHAASADSYTKLTLIAKRIPAHIMDIRKDIEFVAASIQRESASEARFKLQLKQRYNERLKYLVIRTQKDVRNAISLLLEYINK